MIDPRWAPYAAAMLAGIAVESRATVYLSVEEAQQLMFPNEILQPRPLVLSPDQAAAIERASGVRVANPALQVWRAAGGGWFFLDAVIGRSELITYALALDAEGRVKQLEVLEYLESHGGEVRYPRWRAQFHNKRAGDAVMLGRDIQGISGATLSCEHLTDGVRRLLATHDIALRSL